MLTVLTTSLATSKGLFMRRSTKATLYSAFIFPGIGQFVVKKYLLGTLFLVTAIAATTLIIWDIWVRLQHVAQEITQKMVAENHPINALALSEAMTNKLQDGSFSLWKLPPPDNGYSLAAYALSGYIICYIASTINAYLEGRAMDARTVD